VEETSKKNISKHNPQKKIKNSNQGIRNLLNLLFHSILTLLSSFP